MSISESWRYVLGLSGFEANNEITAKYKKLRSQHHPDKGGDTESLRTGTKRGGA